MKQRLFTIGVTGCLIMGLVACNDNRESDRVEPVEAVICADIDNLSTRAIGTSWDPGDVIGVSTLSTEGKTHYINCPYIYDVDGFGPAGEMTIYFQDDHATSFCAYYPYGGTAGTDAGILTARTDAEHQGADIDFLFATGARASKDSPTIGFTGEASFAHCMSQLTLTFVEGFNVSLGNGQLEGYSIEGLRLSGTFDTATGTAGADTEADAETLSILLAPDAISGGTCTSTVILFPQEAPSLTLTVRLDGTDHTVALPLPDNELKAGNNYSYLINVSSPVGVTAGNVSITGWADVSGNDVNASM